mmetsp:Transcript_126362/g.365799  ORF Transcript_126362/g.365799 Transcript_126362/m.365799 type:complete len:537 (-) Transcript_126362:8-1618(-)
MTKDDEPLLATLVQGHEHVRAGLLLHAAKLRAAVAGDPTLAILRDVHLCGVVPRRHIGDRHTPPALREEPTDELPATLALLERAGDEGDLADILQDGARGRLQLLTRRPLLPQRIAHLVVLEEHPVCVEAALRALLVADAPSERAGVLRLDAGHHLQLRATPRAFRTADHQLLALPLAAVAVRLAHEEHQHTPLLLHATKRRAPGACDVADAIGGHINHGAIVALLPIVHIEGALKLIEEPLHVLAGTLPLCAGAGEERRVPNVLHDGPRGALQLLPGAALLAKGIRELVVLKGHRVGAPCARLVLAFISGQHVFLDAAEVPGHLGLHCGEHQELGAPAPADCAENGKLLVVLVPATARADIAEEHQRAPLFLHGAEEVARAAGHEPDGLLRNLEHRQVVVVVIGRDHDRTCALGHNSLGVLLRAAPLHLGSAKLEDEVALEELDLGLGHARDLLLRLPTLPEDKGGVVIGDLDCIDTVVVGLLLAASAGAPAVLSAAAAPVAAAAAIPAVVAAHVCSDGMPVNLGRPRGTGGAGT